MAQNKSIVATVVGKEEAGYFIASKINATDTPMALASRVPFTDEEIELKVLPKTCRKA
jgi:hypothetical protein